MISNKTAVITGVGGQDGIHLAGQLLEQGWTVIGICRRSSQPRNYLQNLINKGLIIVEGDITDQVSIQNILQKYRPEHIYGLAAQSHVATSFEQPFYTLDATGRAVLVMLESIRAVSPKSKFYNAASSEMFGSMYSLSVDYDMYTTTEHFNIKTDGDATCKFTANYVQRDIDKYNVGAINTYLPYQDESTPFRPQSPYGIAKLAGYHYTRLYRESYGLFASSGILFNHEGENRSLTFVTRKITNYVARLKLWKSIQEENEKSSGIDYVYNLPEDMISVIRNNKNNEPYGHKDAWLFGCKFPKLHLGNLDAKRDWMWAGDATRAMKLILDADTPDDYVVGTGITTSIRDFAKMAFEEIGENWENCVITDESLVRPAEVDYLRANPTKIKEKLGWAPTLSVSELCKKMVQHDIERVNLKYKNYGDI